MVNMTRQVGEMEAAIRATFGRVAAVLDEQAMGSRSAIERLGHRNRNYRRVIHVELFRAIGPADAFAARFGRSGKEVVAAVAALTREARAHVEEEKRSGRPAPRPMIIMLKVPI